MFDPILAIAAVAFIATPVILYFAILDGHWQRSSDRGREERRVFRR